MTEARARRTFRFAVHASFWQRTFVMAGLLALVGVLALGSAVPGLAAHSPALASAAPAGSAAEVPTTPTSTEVRPQEGEEDPQYAERDTSTDNTWIVIAVVLMIGLTVLGFALAGLGLSAE